MLAVGQRVTVTVSARRLVVGMRIVVAVSRLGTAEMGMGVDVRQRLHAQAIAKHQLTAFEPSDTQQHCRGYQSDCDKRVYVSADVKLPP